MADVRLPDLEVIRRYSIAVRSEHAPAEEVAEALRADLAAIERAGAGGRTRAAARPRKAASRGRGRARPQK